MEKKNYCYVFSFVGFTIVSYFLLQHIEVKSEFLLLIFIIISSLIITFNNLEMSIHSSLMIYSVFAKIFHLKNPNVNYIDGDGVPYVDYGYKNGKYVGMQRNPLTISNKADWYYSRYLESNDKKFLNFFMNCILSLEQIRETKKMDTIEYELYPYSFVTDEKYQDCPWYSAMAQSAISVTFLKAYHLTQEKKYLINSDLAMNALRIPIKNGGVLDIDPNDEGYWFEEVASKNKINAKTNILNGHLFCILDLLNYQKERQLDHVTDMLEKSISETKKHIDEYDLGYWTYYDRVKHFAFDYHYIHVKLFKDLYDNSKDPFFNYYYRKWRFYLPFNPMWVRKRFVAVLLNLLICGCIIIVIKEFFYQREYEFFFKKY